MLKTEKDEGLRMQAAIRSVLFDVWDPIGVNDIAPRDEYDSYIGGVYRLLASNASKDELVAHLRKLEIEWMECPTTPDHRAMVADKLRELNLRIEK